MAFELDKHALAEYLKFACEYELHILRNTNVSSKDDHGKTA